MTGHNRKHPVTWAEKTFDLKGIDSRFATRAIGWWCEWISFWLSGWAFLEVLQHIGKLTILIAVITYIYPGCKDRKQASEDSKKTRHYIAWQTINSAVGKPGNAGRVDALQDLNKDGVRLDGISLSGKAVLQGPLDLTNASLTHADFSDGVYEQISFSGANLYMSKWDNANVENCDFKGVSFCATTFRECSFTMCDFGLLSQGLKQKPSDFIMQFDGNGPTKFSICNFAGAVYPLGIWNSVSFSWCNFAFADIGHVAIGKNVNGFCLNLYKSTCASPDFIQWAYSKYVVFSNVVSLESWHACIKDPKSGFKVGGPQFMEWASNQFTTYIKTNDAKAWIEWKNEHLK